MSDISSALNQLTPELSKPKNSGLSAQVCEDNQFHWQRLDSLKFAMQVVLTVAVLSLCIGKLMTNVQADDKPLYWGGITGLIAWWMPSPNGTQSKSK